MLTKEEILATEDRETITVTVPEWGGDVRLRTMSGSQRDQYEQRLYHSRKGNEIVNLRATLLAFCLVDDDDRQMFTADEIDALGGKAAKPIAKLFEAAQRLNWLDDEALEDAKGN